MNLFQAAAMIGLLMMATTAEGAGDIATGKSLAQEHCVRCHDIEPGGAFKQHPPSFAAIAVFRPPEQIRGRIFFPTRHANMPQLGYALSPENIDDLVAYIVSLEE